MLKPWCNRVSVSLLIFKYLNLLTSLWTHSLQDLLMRNETNRLVTDLVDLDRVWSLLKTIPARIDDNFCTFRKEKGREVRERYIILVMIDVPSIVVKNIPKRLQCRQEILLALARGWKLGIKSVYE